MKTYNYREMYDKITTEKGIKFKRKIWDLYGNIAIAYSQSLENIFISNDKDDPFSIEFSPNREELISEDWVVVE